MLGHTTDAGGPKLEVLGVDGVGAAELLVTRFLPFGGQGGVD
jgi:hypothetical protein